MRIKSGAELNGLHFMLWYSAALADWLRQAYGFGEATITSGRDPGDAYGPARVRTSRHPGGHAIDLRTNDLPGGSTGTAALQWAQGLQNALGPQFYVLLESDHLHIEWNAPLRA